MKTEKPWTITDLLRSETAIREKIPNVPTKEQMENLKVMISFLHSLREKTSDPLTITSCFRSPALNSRVGGSTRSFHLRGLACDLTSKDLKKLDELVENHFPVWNKGKDLWTKVYPKQNFLHLQFSIK